MRAKQAMRSMRTVLVLAALDLCRAASAAAADDPLVAKAVREVDAVVARGPFAARWDTLAKFQVPAWSRDGKFGIFTHGGASPVPAFGNGWYPRNMYKQDDAAFRPQVEPWGPQSGLGYKDFTPLSRAEKLDARRW